MTYSSAKRKLLIERIAMFPFVWLGRFFGWLFPLKTEHDVFLFFPNGDIGGSPRVNIDITECIKDKKPLIIFSKKPNNNQFLERFQIEGARIIDLHNYIDRKALHFVNFFFRGVIVSWINRREKAAVLGGECIFFYKIVPHLNKKVRRIEVCHLDTWLPYSIGFINEITTRVFSTEKLKQQVERQYKENNLPEHYFEKLLFIDNTIDIPPFTETANEWMEVYFIGRGSPQKRIHLIAAIAEEMRESGDAVHFNFVGDVEKMIDVSAYPYCRFYGNVKEEVVMKRIYEEADVLLMTSAFEGLPVVVMQMMAQGRVVVSTAVNGIPDYIFHEENGLLIHATDEKEIIAEGISHLRSLIQDQSLRARLGAKARSDASEKFGRAVFCEKYRKLLT